MATGPTSRLAITAARSDPAAASTALMSSVHSSQVGTVVGTPSEAPVPRRSNQIKRLNEESRVRRSLDPQGLSQFDVVAEAITKEKVDGTIADDLIGDLRIAHAHILCLGRIHDGYSLPGSTGWRRPKMTQWNATSWASPQAGSAKF